MKRLMLGSLLSCLVVSSVQAKLSPSMQGVGYALLGGLLGYGIGKRHNAPRDGFQLGVALAVIGAMYNCHKCTSENIKLTAAYQGHPAQAGIAIDNSRELRFGAGMAGFFAFLASFCFGRS